MQPAEIKNMKINFQVSRHRESIADWLVYRYTFYGDYIFFLILMGLAFVLVLMSVRVSIFRGSQMPACNYLSTTPL